MALRKVMCGGVRVELTVESAGCVMLCATGCYNENDEGEIRPMS